MCSFVRQCFNQQSSCSKYKVHFLSSSGLEPHRQGKVRAQPWDALEIIWHFPCPQQASAHHSIPASSLCHFCWLSDVSLLTPHPSPQRPAWKERIAQNTVHRDPCQNSTHRHLFADTPEAAASKRTERAQRPPTFNPTSLGPCKTCVKYYCNKL